MMFNMNSLISIFFLFCSGFLTAQKIAEIPLEPGSGFQKNYIHYPFQKVELRSFGETWFATAFELVNIGEIEPLSNSGQQALLVSLFPDSNIITGVDVVSNNPIYASLHGMADVINPSRTPSQWADEWTEIVIDSIEIPFAYVRNTPNSIIDTMFVDYIKSIPDDLLSYYDLNGNGIGDFGEFPHQSVFRSNEENNKLNPIQIFRTDTVLLTSVDSSFKENISVNFKRIDVNDTIKNKNRYGVYIRFQPGYDWTIQDSLKDLNEFFLLTREQEVGEVPRQIWDYTAGFCSYSMNKSTRYTGGARLVPGIIPQANWQLEHLIVSYKLTTNALYLNEPLINVGIDIFPNPSSSFVIVDFFLKESQNIEIEIYDLIGKLVFKESIGLIEAGSSSRKVNINNLPGGVYFLRVGATATKFVVK